MDALGLWSLQLMMFLLVAVGVILKKRGILKAEAKGILTELLFTFFLPCNIIQSFNVSFDVTILKNFGLILLISLGVQLVCFVLSHVFYRREENGRRRVMQYCTIVSNSGFLGLPIIQGIYGSEGMMYASVFIIPMRIMMWSAGLSCFTGETDFRETARKIVFHPCIVAVYIGIVLMTARTFFGESYQVFLAEAPVLLRYPAELVLTALSKLLSTAGGCMTALTMLLIGMIVSELSPKEFWDAGAIRITGIRLVLLPLIVWAVCSALHISGFLTAVSVLLTGMPAGSTAAILASQYGCDYRFATKCVIVSTLVSMLSIPVWGMLL
ncbi:MAG: AEC family transporter [Eubacteriales bacterium]|nr:AEC family transporter [Eubacteriales bacterium]